MTMVKRIRTSAYLAAFLLLSLALSPHDLLGRPGRPMEIEDLFRAKRVSDPQVSPDGKWVAFVVATVDKAANSSNSDIWIMPATGGKAALLAGSPKQDRHPRWSPDSRWILFESNRNGTFQLYRTTPDGAAPQQLTTISTEASQGIWSRDGSRIGFVSAVLPEFSEKPFAESDRLNRQADEDRERSKVKARIITKLLYRHWDSWVDNKRLHIFVMPADGGEPKDVTPGDRDAVPNSSTFSAGDDFDFSPDGTELAYTATPQPPHSESWSTNHDIYILNLLSGERRQLTTNQAADGFPRYSPDGSFIAYRAQSRPGFEADRWQLMLYDRKKRTIRSLTENFDASVQAMVWSNDSKKLYFPAEDNANQPLWSVSVRGNDVTRIVENATNSDIQVTDDGTLVYAHVSMTRPTEIFAARGRDHAGKPLTHVNDSLFAAISCEQPVSMTFGSAGGTRVQMWLVRPPGFDPAGKYPLVYMIHGGPQGAWENGWSYRWNPELWAAQGYVVALPNPRGSTGFGQKFVDEISRDWGGRVYEDLMHGLDTLVTFPYIDTVRKAAAGASFGGYMMNWFEGHTDRFRTIVSHDGTYNFASSYGVTEETWFDEWEHGIPWETQDFDKYSPNKYAANFKTPMLLIHGELDFRVPVGEGLQLFTALQRRGITSKLLYFPDEGHWVLKPQNSELWHRTVFDWLAGYLKP
ncbi:MAG TPA: S9 family peptidase [Bacteroidota bacterium]|nr:S9 family peptidase [Bacteroidota bacterium]